MRQYPIWNIISGQGKKGSADFGSHDGFTQIVRVGTSSSNSHEFVRIDVRPWANTDGSQRFDLYIDGVKVRSSMVADKELTVLEDTLV